MAFLYIFLGVDQVIVNLNFKRTTARSDQCQVFNYVLVITEKLFRQTDGSW